MGHRARLSILVLALAGGLLGWGVSAFGQGPTTTTTSTTTLPYDLLPATATVNPADGLFEAEILDVRAQGFDPSSRVRVYQCAPSTSSLCPLSSIVRSVISAADGSIETRVQVRTMLWGSYDRSADCRVVSCDLLVTGSYEGEFEGHPGVLVPIAFDPEAPTVAQPWLTVTPGTGLVDGQRVSVEGGSFPLCEGWSVEDCDQGIDLHYCRVVEEDFAPIGPCEVIATPRLEGVGHFVVDIPLPARFGHGPQAIDCRVDRCGLWVDVPWPLNSLGPAIPVEFETESPPPSTSPPPAPVPPAPPVSEPPTFTG